MELNNGTLRMAVKLWLENEKEAIKQYGHISNWNTSNVTNMSFMFYNASAFNQDISQWNVSNVTDMDLMFYNATEFNQDISQWNVDNVHEMYCIIKGTVLHTRLNGESCFNKVVMKKLFPYNRRKNFLKFLVESGYIPYQETCLKDSYHKIFSKEDIYKIIMSYI